MAMLRRVVAILAIQSQPSDDAQSGVRTS